jgi:hypothetical protein
VAGTDERHPAVAVFPYLGPMALKQLLDAGISVAGCDLLVLCDNDFGPDLVRGLEGAGAHVAVAARPLEVAEGPPFDAVVLALRPQAGPVLTAEDLIALATRWPGAVLAQFWGDLDRAALAAAGVPAWPAEPPAPGHMGILPSDIGPEPVVRLQAGGLKVGEVLGRGGGGPFRDLVQGIVPIGRPG